MDGDELHAHCSCTGTGVIWSYGNGTAEVMFAGGADGRVLLLR